MFSVSGIAMGEAAEKARDLLGRVYEYFLGGFAGSEGKRGGEFHTPRSVVVCWWRCWNPPGGESMTPAAAPGACSSAARSASRPTAASSTTSPSTANHDISVI